MGNRRFEMYQYRQILLRMRQGATDRELARLGIIGRLKAKAIRALAVEQGWLSPERPLPDDAILSEHFGPQKEAPRTSSVLPWSEQITTWVSQGIQGTTIYTALKNNHGFEGSYSSVRRFIQSIPKDPAKDATVRLEFAPGEAAQIDFGAGPLIYNPLKGTLVKTWFFVMTLCYSRHQYLELVFDQKLETWLGLHRRAFQWFGAVPKTLIIDNPKCAITKASYSDPVVQRSYAELTEGYSFRLNPCPPHDPAKKGRVESGINYVKRSFLPTRTFRNLEDANRQAQEWVMGEAGTRLHGTTRKRPLDLFNEVEKPLMLALPEHPVVLGFWDVAKVARTGHVRFDRNDYSVPYRLIGKKLWVRGTESTVSVFFDHEQVAIHGRLSGEGQCRSLPDHMPPNARDWFAKDADWCRNQAKAIGPACLELIETMLGDKILDRLRPCQNILGLAKTHTPKRLENACRRALDHNTLGYQKIKTILNKALDMEVTPSRKELPLPPAHSGKGKYIRIATDLFNWKESRS